MAIVLRRDERIQKIENRVTLPCCEIFVGYHVDNDKVHTEPLRRGRHRQLLQELEQRRHPLALSVDAVGLLSTAGTATAPLVASAGAAAIVQLNAQETRRNRTALAGKDVSHTPK